MSIEHGFSDRLWAARKIVEMSHPILLKRAVIGVIDHLDQVNSSGTSPFEIIDRIVQVASEGKYIPPQSEEETVVATLRVNEDGSLSPEDEKVLRDFGVQLDDLLGTDTEEDDHDEE